MIRDDSDRRTRGLRASWGRFVATFVKELIQLRRDRLTFATMIVIPLVQLMLFGYAINTNPKHLPAAVLVQDDSAFARSFLAALRATEYFDIRHVARSEDELDRLLLSGAARRGRVGGVGHDEEGRALAADEVAAEIHRDLHSELRRAREQEIVELRLGPREMADVEIIRGA